MFYIAHVSFLYYNQFNNLLLSFTILFVLWTHSEPCQQNWLDELGW